MSDSKNSGQGVSRVLGGLGCAVGGAWIVLIMLFLAIWQFLSPDRPPVTQVAYSELRALAIADPATQPHIEAAVFKGREIAFWVKDPKTNVKMRKMAFGPENTDELAREMADHHISVAFEREDGTDIWAGVILLVVIVVLSLAISIAVVAGVKLSRVRKELASANAEVDRLKGLLEHKEPAS